MPLKKSYKVPFLDDLEILSGMDSWHHLRLLFAGHSVHYNASRQGQCSYMRSAYNHITRGYNFQRITIMQKQTLPIIRRDTARQTSFQFKIFQKLSCHPSSLLPSTRPRLLFVQLGVLREDSSRSFRNAHLTLLLNHYKSFVVIYY